MKNLPSFDDFIFEKKLSKKEETNESSEELNEDKSDNAFGGYRVNLLDDGSITISSSDSDKAALRFVSQKTVKDVARLLSKYAGQMTKKEDK